MTNICFWLYLIIGLLIGHKIIKTERLFGQQKYYGFGNVIDIVIVAFLWPMFLSSLDNIKTK